MATYPWPIHPAAELFPLLEGDEFNDLVKDIRTNGLHEPAWLYEDPELGKCILDGRNRVRACQEAGVMVTWRQYLGDDPIGFATSENVRRRHLSAGQLALLALDTERLYAAEAARRKATIGEQTGGLHHSEHRVPADRPEPSESARRQQESREKAAKAVGTTGRGVSKAKRIAERAADLAEKVRSGKMALDQADRIIRDRENEARRREALAALPEPSVDLRRGDFREVLDDLNGKVDVVITDPPYPAEYLPLLSDLSEHAARWLKPGGLAAIMMGQSYLPEVLERLGEHLEYHWTIAYLTPGGQAVQLWDRHVNTFWKPVLVYSNGPYRGEWFGDVAKSDVNDNDKAHHHWGQSESGMADLIKRLSREGDLICDPFLGGGTTALVAAALNRNCIGCDLEWKTP